MAEDIQSCRCTIAAEWVLVDAACHAYSMVSVPLYDTLGPDTVEYIANHAGLAAVGVAAEVRWGGRGAGRAGGAGATLWGWLRVCALRCVLWWCQWVCEGEAARL